MDLRSEPRRQGIGEHRAVHAGVVPGDHVETGRGVYDLAAVGLNDDLAAAVHRGVSGMAVGEFLTRLRMMIAADMLVSGDEPVSAVANTVGYRSTSAFGRAFRAATATTPARFRSHVNAAARPATTPRRDLDE